MMKIPKPKKKSPHLVKFPILLMVVPWTSRVYMDVSENSGTPESSILIGFSIIFTIHFGIPLFLETPIYCTIDPVSEANHQMV